MLLWSDTKTVSANYLFQPIISFPTGKKTFQPLSSNIMRHFFSPSIEGVDGTQADLSPPPLDIQDIKQAH